MNIKFDDTFDSFESDPKSRVFQMFPDVFLDARGAFAEIYKETSLNPIRSDLGWFRSISWVKQINRSKSLPGTVRGCHAQTGEYCQGKLVQALTYPIYDVITDARPDSGTFGVTSVYLLDPEKQNQLWVPRGFLHAFAVPKLLSSRQMDKYGRDGLALFEYFCDNVYCKQAETGVNPMTLLPKVAENIASALTESTADDYAAFTMMFESQDGFNLSDKDTVAKDYELFMSEVKSEYEKTGKVWYK